jgi:hypothetical protein
MPHVIIELAEEAEVVAVMPMLEVRMVVVEAEVKAGAEPPTGEEEDVIPLTQVIIRQMNGRA